MVHLKIVCHNNKTMQIYKWFFTSKLKCRCLCSSKVDNHKVNTHILFKKCILGINKTHLIASEYKSTVVLLSDIFISEVIHLKIQNKLFSDLQTKLKEIDVGDEITERYTAEKEKYSKMRRQLAKKTRQVEAMKRVIDDVPGRAELSQYQRRFIELYNQGKFFILIMHLYMKSFEFINIYRIFA